MTSETYGVYSYGRRFGMDGGTFMLLMVIVVIIMVYATSGGD